VGEVSVKDLVRMKIQGEIFAVHISGKVLVPRICKEFLKLKSKKTV
jgi:hypothetical protein